ncbi:uncharacterized protein VDAG_02418 [Verticillium dahliae VdLs.17]|uniref:Uncharacterized protein n=1 Tax=Verticillium dahliae (strain VdLs.17 / ATCC MYA-4575 / FGSC 10137) TaxID=498257 RepID=G2WXT6_VERDV|nr:uncharacterized protein VDAG_02418 [Verticillium dahliae VdLs.17]EGY20894.1 hypothetical protein VDAG_02418 [Verticillium dahliae VdLs.17]
MRSIISLAIAWLAATVVAQSDESGKYEAVFFFYAYANDWMMHPGNNTIGGRKSGGSKGGYGGCWNPTTRYDINIGDAYGIARRLELQNKKLYWDHITYVMNTFGKDADKKGSLTQFVNVAANALQLMNKAVAKDDVDALKEWIGDKAPNGFKIDILDLPLGQSHHQIFGGLTFHLRQTM